MFGTTVRVDSAECGSQEPSASARAYSDRGGSECHRRGGHAGAGAQAGPAMARTPGAYSCSRVRRRYPGQGSNWRGLTRAPSRGDGVMSPSVSVRERVCARACLRSLAVWPLESGRVASGLSPHGVASFYMPRLGLRSYQGRMVCNLPGPCPTPVPDLQ